MLSHNSRRMPLQVRADESAKLGPCSPAAPGSGRSAGGGRSRGRLRPAPCSWGRSPARCPPARSGCAPVFAQCCQMNFGCDRVGRSSTSTGCGGPDYTGQPAPFSRPMLHFPGHDGQLRTRPATGARNGAQHPSDEDAHAGTHGTQHGTTAVDDSRECSAPAACSRRGCGSCTGTSRPPGCRSARRS